MKYYVTGLVKCTAGLEVDANSVEEAVRVAKEKCLHGDPLDPPEFDIESVVRTFEEDSRTEPIPAEEIAKACDRLEEIFSEDEEEPIHEDENSESCCSKANKNKKCGGCKKNLCSESFEYVSLFPLIDWLESLEEGDDEWDCV